MATYKGIQGYSVQKLSSDPTAANVEGQLWYNSTAGAFKVSVAAAGAWATTNSLNTARRTGANAKLATQSAALTYGGETDTPSPSTSLAVNESYNGTSWTEVNNLNTARSELGGLGTQTAAVAFGGFISETTTYQAITETWDGTSWTEVNNLNTTRGEMGSTGTSTAGLSFGGYYPSHHNTGETWDGTCWTETTELQTSGYYIAGAGSSTSALATGRAGNPSGPGALTEIYNGTSWSETGDLNALRDNGAAFGTVNTSAIFCGGYRPPANPPVANSAQTEQFNGSTWTALADMGTARNFLVGCGTTTLGLVDMGTGGASAATEEWSGSPIAVKTVTVS